MIIVIRQVKKLKEEAARLGQLRHQNIVLLLGFVDEPQCCALVLEFCKHGSFFDLLNKYDVDINLKVIAVLVINIQLVKRCTLKKIPHCV